LDAQIERRRRGINKPRKGNRYWRGSQRVMYCEQCEQPFWAARRDARYCSPACRQASYRFSKAFYEELCGPGSWEADHARQK
jgi:hypothetical protein